MVEASISSAAIADADSMVKNMGSPLAVTVHSQSFV